MTSYRERLHAGYYEPGAQAEAEPEPEAEPAPLPRTHAALDQAALEAGHDWTSEDLTVAEKQAELNGIT